VEGLRLIGCTDSKKLKLMRMTHPYYYCRKICLLMTSIVTMATGAVVNTNTWTITTSEKEYKIYQLLVGSNSQVEITPR